MKQARVLLADDHVLVLEGFRRLLEPEFTIVGTVENGSAILAMAEKLHPDVVLLDISMPIVNGFDAAVQLRNVAPHTKVIFVTMHMEPAFITEAFRLGASGYVLKQAAASELITAIKSTLQNRRYVSSGIPEDIRDTALAIPQGEPTEGLTGKLTTRQREVLTLIAQGHTTKEIGQALDISPKTVEFHKAKIMRELGLRKTAELTKYAVAHGMVSL